MRNSAIDITKGIAILLVVVGHQRDIPDLLRSTIFSFHMPLFFIISGLYYKKRSYVDQIRKDTGRLLMPYAFTCFIFLIWWMLRFSCWGTPDLIKDKIISCIFGSGSFHSSLILGHVPYIGAIWFLLAIFWCRLFYNVILQSFKSLRAQHFACIGLAIIATLLDCYLINLPFSILPGLSAIIFFMIGNSIPIYKCCLQNNKGLLLLIGAFCFVIAINHSHLWMVVCSYGMYPIDIVAGCFGTYIVYIISVLVNKTRFSKFFEWLGKNSMTILCLHFLELHTGIWNVLHLNYHWTYMILIKFVVIITVAIILSRVPVVRSIYSITPTDKNGLS